MIKSQIIVKHKNLKPYELALSLLYLKHLPNLMYSQSYSTVSLTCDDEEFQAQLIIDIWTGICPFQFILLIFISYLCSACNFDLHYVVFCVGEIWHLFETLDKDHTNTLHCSSLFKHIYQRKEDYKNNVL